MNQDKLEVVKQEIARVNVDILGISEIKWTGIGEFNSDDHYKQSYKQLNSLSVVGRVIFSYSPFLLPLPLSLPASLSAH